MYFSRCGCSVDENEIKSKPSDEYDVVNKHAYLCKHHYFCLFVVSISDIHTTNVFIFLFLTQCFIQSQSVAVIHSSAVDAQCSLCKQYKTLIVGIRQHNESKEQYLYRVRLKCFFCVMSFNSAYKIKTEKFRYKIKTEKLQRKFDLSIVLVNKSSSKMKQLDFIQRKIDIVCMTFAH